MMKWQGEPGSVPFAVRKDMLKTLLGRADVLVMGCVAHVACTVIMWSTSDDVAYLLWAPFFVAALVARLMTMRRLEKKLPAVAHPSELDTWERIYISFGAGTSLLAGTLAAYACVADPDTMAPVVGMGVVGGTLITIVGRAFGSLVNVRVLVYSCCLPSLVGFLASGWLNGEVAMALVAVPMTVVIMASFGTASYLHGLLLSALRTKRQSEIASQKFEAAIGSMPNGLIVVGGNQKMVVVNQVADRKLAGNVLQGGDLFEMLRSTMARPAELMAAIKSRSADFTDGDVSWETLDGRWLRFRTSDMESSSKAYLDEEWGGRQDGAYILTILDVTKKLEADRKLEHLARFDGLTGLANRRWWEEHGQAAVAASPARSLVALAVLDVDRFKLINDTLGHHIGDKVIQGVADRIRAMQNPRAFAGRLGGDEFVVLLQSPGDVEDATAFFDRLFASICTTYVIEGHNIEVRCSGGVIVRRREKFNIHTDLSRADMALYKVKRTSRSWMMFDERMEDEYQSSVRIKHDLKDAIEQGTLELVYQPIYDAKGERIVSAEALSRWEHYEAGAIPPAKFIAMAEEMGVIGHLTEYVLRRACRECMTWNADIAVAVNLSTIDLARDGIVEMIRNALTEAGMPAERLCIEVTESVFVKDFDKTAATLSVLREMGVKTSLDDFGTGYSSLSYMHRLPLNRVKIDKSFVTSIVEEEKTRQLFSAVVGLAKGLGFEVVVEGVERRDQLDRVVAVPGVDMIQGHVFSKGLTNAEMAVMSVRPRLPQDGKVVRLVKGAAG